MTRVAKTIEGAAGFFFGKVHCQSPGRPLKKWFAIQKWLQGRYFFWGGEGYVFKASFLLIFLVVIVVAGADTCFFW